MKHPLEASVEEQKRLARIRELGNQLIASLSKREYFAGLAMQGALAARVELPPEDIADWAIRYADALLSEFETRE